MSRRHLPDLRAASFIAAALIAGLAAPHAAAGDPTRLGEDAPSYSFTYAPDAPWRWWWQSADGFVYSIDVRTGSTTQSLHRYPSDETLAPVSLATAERRVVQPDQDALRVARSLLKEPAYASLRAAIDGQRQPAAPAEPAMAPARQHEPRLVRIPADAVFRDDIPYTPKFRAWFDDPGDIFVDYSLARATWQGTDKKFYWVDFVAHQVGRDFEDFNYRDDLPEKFLTEEQFALRTPAFDDSRLFFDALPSTVQERLSRVLAGRRNASQFVRLSPEHPSHDLYETLLRNYRLARQSTASIASAELAGTFDCEAHRLQMYKTPHKGSNVERTEGTLSLKGVSITLNGQTGALRITVPFPSPLFPLNGFELTKHRDVEHGQFVVRDLWTAHETSSDDVEIAQRHVSWKTFEGHSYTYKSLENFNPYYDGDPTALTAKYVDYRRRIPDSHYRVLQTHYVSQVGAAVVPMHLRRRRSGFVNTDNPTASLLVVLEGQVSAVEERESRRSDDRYSRSPEGRLTVRDRATAITDVRENYDRSQHLSAILECHRVTL